MGLFRLKKVALGLVPNKRRIDVGRYWGWETSGGGKQKIANNIKNGVLKEKYENIFPSS